MAEGGSGGTAPFKLWPAQLWVCYRLMIARLVIILKARQLGISWIVCGYALWLCLFKPGQLILLFSQGEKEAIELLRRVRVLYERLPDWLREGLPSQVDEFPLDVDEDTTTLFGWSNGSRVQSLPATKKAGRGNAASLVIADEFAFLQWPDELYTALKPTIDGGGRLIILSTADGVGGLFHWLWVQADAKLNDFLAIFLPWWARPGRDQRWYAKMRAESKDPAKVRQEYPASSTEAFITSGRVRFDGDWIEAQQVHVLPPIPRKSWPKTLPDVVGFDLFELPPDGAKLVLSADVAEGRENRDYSTAVLIDQESWVEYGELHGHWEPDHFGDLLADLADFFNAKVLVERNNHGHATIAKLKARCKTRVVFGDDNHWGWVTSTRSKPIAVDALAVALRDGLLKVRSPAALSELRIYRVKADGGTEAPDGFHDDRVMARAIFFGAHHLSLLSKRKIKAS